MPAFINNGRFAVSDFSIAVAQDGPNTHSMIYIYPISTVLCNVENNTQNSTPKTTTNKRRKYNDGTPDAKINNPIIIKKLRYSGEPTDVIYSSRFISMSKDGQYLAISWLPNPRLGENNALKYCVVYDLNKIEPIKIDDKSDSEVHPEIPCAIFEFQGGCIFANDGSFVLINQDKALVYSILQDSSFKLEFSLIVSTSPTPSHIPDNNHAEQIFYVYPVQEDAVVSFNSRNSDTVVISNENYDDIFFDSPGDESISDFDEDKDKDDIETTESHKSNENNSVTRGSSSYEEYVRNKNFITYNIRNIKDQSIVCLISAALSNSNDSNSLEPETYSLFVWSMIEKRQIFVKKLKRGEPQSDLNYITVLNKQRNMVAVSKINPFISDCNTHQILKIIDSPISTIYDCESGLAVAELRVPKSRIISSIIQILFLQNDTYLLVISHSNENVFFDIWDVLSGIHLDTYKMYSSIEYSEFILKSHIPLTSGCGIYMQMKYQTPEGPLYGTLNDSPIIYAHRIQFFKKDTTKKECMCCKGNLIAFSNFTSPLVCSHCPTHIDNLLMGPNTGNAHQSFDFLDNNHRYMMLCQWSPTSTGSDILFITVWEVSSKSRGGLWCEDVYRKHDKHKINFKQLKYSFTLNRNEFIQHQRSMAGHPTMFLNIKDIREHCIKRLWPVVFYNDVPKKTPVLLLNMDHRSISNNTFPEISPSIANTEDSQKGKAFYSVAIPLHKHSALESHLHALANQTVLSVFDINGVQIERFHYDDYVHNIYVNNASTDGLAEPDHLPTKEKLIELIHSSGKFFSTLAGYAIICRLAVTDDNHDVLSAILKDTTKINYCVLATRDHNLIDPLQEALKFGAMKNVLLIVRHLKHSMVTYGVEYGYLLVKHCQLLADSVFLDLLT